MKINIYVCNLIAQLFVCLFVCVLKSDPRNERMLEISHVDPWIYLFLKIKIKLESRI